MSAITNSQFLALSSGMGGNKLESKKKEGPADKPPHIIYIGPMPPKKFRNDNTIYMDPHPLPPPPPPPPKAPSKKNTEFAEPDAAAFNTIASWKNTAVYATYATTAEVQGSLGSSVEHGPVTYSGYKSLAVGSGSPSSDFYKQTAVHPSISSSGNCSIS